MTNFMEQEFRNFTCFLKYIEKYIKFLFKNNPIVKKEWDIEDFYQELALKYFKNILQINCKSKSTLHKLYILKKIAKQIFIDKLISLQRSKRDVRKEKNNEIRFVECKTKNPIDSICTQENLNIIQSKTSKEVWQTLEWRSQGKSWKYCSKNIGYNSPESLRMKVKRQINSIKVYID